MVVLGSPSLWQQPFVPRRTKLGIMKTPIIPSKISTFHDLRTSQEVWLLQTDLELCSFQLTEKLVNDYLELSIASLCQVCVLGSLLIYREASPPLFFSFLLRQIANKNSELDFHNCFTYFTLKCLYCSFKCKAQILQRGFLLKRDT